MQEIIRDLSLTFLMGGTICVLAQLLIDRFAAAEINFYQHTISLPFLKSVRIVNKYNVKKYCQQLLKERQSTLCYINNITRNMLCQAAVLF